MNLATVSLDSSTIPEESEYQFTDLEEAMSLDLLLLDRSQVNKELINVELLKSNMSATIEEADSALSLLDKLEEKKWDCIIIVIDQFTISLSQLFKAIPENNQNTPLFILMDEYERESALKYISDGAEDVVAPSELSYLPKSIKKKVSEAGIATAIDSLRKDISQNKQNHDALIENLPSPYAILQEGMVVIRNQAFNSLLNLGVEQSDEEFSFLDFVEKHDMERMKKVFRQFSNNEKLTKITLRDVALKNTLNEAFTADFCFLKTEIDSEVALQILINPVLRPTNNDVPELTHTIHVQPTDKNDNLLQAEHFKQLLQQTISSKRENVSYALALFEISNHESLKQQLGITQAEILLNNASEFMRNITSQDTRVTRINSQLYGILIISNSPESGLQKVETIAEAFKTTPVYSNAQPYHFESNVGLVYIEENVTSSEQALSLAESACAVSRNVNGNKIYIYDPQINDESLASEDIESVNQIKHALENEEFKLAYQPILHIKNTPTPIYEVLLRMQSGDGETLLPSEFLPLAKKVSLCSEIDRWVVSQAITVLRTSNQPKLRLFINISENSITDLSFVEWLKTNDASYLKHLVFEISEKIAASQTAATLLFGQECKALGVEICIEHFGNNLDVLNALKSLAIKFCKVDGAFTSHLSTNRKNQITINNISQQTKKLGIQTIACFVQDADSLAVLWQEGFDYVQGDYLQSPDSSLSYQFNSF